MRVETKEAQALASYGVLEELSSEMKRHLDYFFEKIDLEKMAHVLDRLLACEGTIFLTGVGKSGIIAKKIATTLSSSGTKALYLSPTNALHGDIGIVSARDCVLLLSKSGETDELLYLCPAMRNKKAHLIAVVSQPHSRLAKATDMSVVLPVQRELCPFNLAPTTSTTVQLIFGDMLAMALMKSRKFTVDDFVHNHPAGQIGKRLLLKVEDLMLRGDDLPRCHPHASLVDTLVELSGKKCGCVLVVDGHESLLGIFTDGDLRRALQRHGADALHLEIAHLMTTTPCTVCPAQLAYDAMKVMESNQRGAITVLPVLDGKKVVGLIRLHDIVQSGL